MKPYQSPAQESRALAEDPTHGQPWQEVPLRVPAPPQRQPQDYSPLSLIVAAVALVLFIAGVILQLAAPPTQEQRPQASAPAADCIAIAAAPMNVRAGPGVAYSHVWVLEAGEARLLYGRTADGWVQLANGWLPERDLRLQPAATCQQIPLVSEPPIFADDLALPPALDALPWAAELDDPFATNQYQWYDHTSARRLDPQEGALLLAAGMRVSPQQPPHPAQLQDAYYTFNLEWLVNEPSAQLLFEYRRSDAGLYRVSLGLDGELALSQVDAWGNTALLRRTQVALAPGLYSLGVWNQGHQHHLYLDQKLVLSVEDDTLSAGDYALGIDGNGAVARIHRFRLKTVALP